MIYAQAVVDGLLIGSIYVLVALGLTLIFGVMDIINMAHGGFVALGAYVAYVLQSNLHLDPFLSAPAVFVAMFGLGWAVNWLLIRRLSKATLVMAVISTFALDLLIVNTLRIKFTATPVGVDQGLGLIVYRIGPLKLSALYLAIFVFATLCSAALYWVLFRTRTGRAIRAVRMDREAAELLGIDVQRVFSIAFGIGTGFAGVAGIFAGVTSSIFPTMGYSYLLIAFIVVIVGGLGSVTGALIAGLAYGALQSVVTIAAGAGYGEAGALLIMIGFLLIRPRGILGKPFYE